MENWNTIFLHSRNLYFCVHAKRRRCIGEVRFDEIQTEKNEKAKYKEAINSTH